MSNKPNPQRTKTRGAPRHQTPSRSIWQSPILWLGGIVVLALVVTVVMTIGDDNDTPTTTATETGFAEIIGAPLPPLSDPDPAIGLIAPNLSAQTFQGERVQVISGDGTARLYGFFAHWCPHCQAELPRTAAWLTANDLPQDVEVVAVSTATEKTADNYPPSAWFAREHWPALVVVDDEAGSLATGFGLTQFPYWVATDADGAVVFRTSGELTTEQFESLLAIITP